MLKACFQHSQSAAVDNRLGSNFVLTDLNLNVLTVYVSSYSSGADIRATNKRKHTPLLAAAAYGKKSAIAALAARCKCNKEDMNQVDGDGKSVLFLTVEAGDDIAVNVSQEYPLFRSILHYRWGT